LAQGIVGADKLPQSTRVTKSYNFDAGQGMQAT
jgi:hypothetical protein